METINFQGYAGAVYQQRHHLASQQALGQQLTLLKVLQDSGTFPTNLLAPKYRKITCMSMHIEVSASVWHDTEQMYRV